MLEDRIDRFLRAFDAWINGSKGTLNHAFTQSQVYFKASDIRHRLAHLKSRLTKEALVEWTHQYDQPAAPQTCLCLHAGNLPLVGFQDVLAVWLAGHRYVGKLSKRDPWLMASFLEVLHAFADDRLLVWHTALEALPHTPVDRVLFSGSEVTVPQVKTVLQELGMVQDHTQWLIRTASFSVAWLEDPSDSDVRDLAEAILRYDGSGCRSVKVVCCNQDLPTYRCALEDTLEQWWSTNGGHRAPTPQTLWDKAYLHAIDQPYLLTEHLLMAGNAEFTDNTDRILWIKGEQEALEAFIQRYATRIQALYHSDRMGEQVIGDRKTEPLRRAQDPDIDWKADGKEVISWLVQ